MPNKVYPVWHAGLTVPDMLFLLVDWVSPDAGDM